MMLLVIKAILTKKLSKIALLPKKLPNKGNTF